MIFAWNCPLDIQLAHQLNFLLMLHHFPLSQNLQVNSLLKCQFLFLPIFLYAIYLSWQNQHHQHFPNYFQESFNQTIHFFYLLCRHFYQNHGLICFLGALFHWLWFWRLEWCLILSKVQLSAEIEWTKLHLRILGLKRLQSTTSQQTSSLTYCVYPIYQSCHYQNYLHRFLHLIWFY